MNGQERADQRALVNEEPSVDAILSERERFARGLLNQMLISPGAPARKMALDALDSALVKGPASAAQRTRLSELSTLCATAVGVLDPVRRALRQS